METSLVDVLFDLANEAVAARIRLRALLELLEERGVLQPGEFDQRGAAVWERDWQEVAGEIAPTILFGDEQGEPEIE